MQTAQRINTKTLYFHGGYVTLDDIRNIEEAIKLKLPQAYIDVVIDYPSELLESDAPDFGLLDDPDEIINENISVRENGYFGEAWPERYIIIGQNGCGDYYVTTPESTSFSVGFSDHEKMECRAYANDLKEFIAKYLSEKN
jgi:hypothetical protein